MLDIEKILNYQETDAKLRAIEAEIETNEDFKRALKAKRQVEDASARLASYDTRADEIFQSYQRIKSGMDDLLGKVAELEKDLEDVTDEDDDLDYSYASLQKLRDSVRSAENELQAILSQIDELSKANEEARKSGAQNRAVFESSKQKFDAYKASRQGDAAAIKRELSEKAKGLDPAFMQRYSAKRAQRIFPVVVPLFDKNRCGTCRMELATNTISQLKARGFIECDSCHRIIYYQESAGKKGK